MIDPVVYGTPWLAFDVVTSTNDLARSWAQAGASAGTLITATSQTNGRGRRGAQWHDTPGQSAIMTFVGSRQASLEHAWRLPFAASLAVLRAAREFGAEQTCLKWPNDIVSGGRKLGGILIETVSDLHAGAVPLIGIGVNVAQRHFADARSFATPPTSLSLVTGGAARSPNAVVEAVAKQMTLVMPLLGTLDGWDRLMGEWGGAMVIGDVQRGVTSSGETQSGTIVSVRIEDGAALVKTADGGIEAIWPSVTLT